MDIRYAFRGLRRNPVFAITAIVTLAVGIGGNTAMFSIIRAVLLKPLNYPNPDQLVMLSGATPTRFEDLRAQSRTLSGVGAFTGSETLTLTGGAEPEVLKGARVSANFLSILGKKPLTGRGFEPADDLPGSLPVALISEEFWDRRYNRDARVTGKTMILSGVPYTIVGVLPGRFAFPFPGSDLWLPQPSEWPLMAASSRRLSPFLTMFGRLNPGITLEQTNVEMALIRHRYATEHPAMLDAKSKLPVEVKLMKDDLVTDVRVMLWMLFGAVGFVLMITCANVASLMLARAKSRSREFAVRAAIGASGARLMSHLLAESLLLSLGGGALGLLFAAVCLKAIPLLSSFDLPRTTEIRLDPAVLLFAIVLSVGTGLLFGLMPAFSAARPDLISALRGSGLAANDGRGFNTRSVLVVAQVAFSMVLLIGATLMLQSLIGLRNVHVGFNPAHLLTASVNLPPLRYSTDQKRTAFFEDLREKIKATPGIQSAAVSMTLPMGAYAGSPVQDAAKPPLRLNQRLIATISVVTPGYFRTLEIPLRRGRDFTIRDKEGAERVAIIDEALARRFWPSYPKGLDPVDQRLLVGGINPNPARIIGVVSAVHQSLENSAWPETVYVAFAQAPQGPLMLAARTAGDPSRFASAVRMAVLSLDRELPLSDVHSMEDLVDNQLGSRRLVVGLLGSFAAISLLLALIGIYGAVSYSVTQRTQELGIRAALGADKGNILRLMLGQGITLAAAGIVIGLVGSFWLTKFLSKLLFGVAATDPATFAAIGLLFVASALLASYIPARRAARMDPMAALRV